MSSFDRPAIVLFRGDPRRDTRQKRLPPAFLFLLHRALLKTLAGAPADVLVAGDDAETFSVKGSRRSGAWRVNSLSGRIEAALHHCFDLGYRRVLLLAGDVVALEASDVVRAIESLAGDRDAVIGTSSDGGFYIAGFTCPPSVDWERILADRSHAAEELIAQLHRGGFGVTQLRRIDDIDSVEDARRLTRTRAFSTPFLRLITQLASLWSPECACSRRSRSTNLAFVGTSTSLRAPPHPVTH